MYVQKCDVCKKEIKRPHDENSVHVGTGWGLGGFIFCPECGEPVLKFLKKHKLLKAKA